MEHEDIWILIGGIFMLWFYLMVLGIIIFKMTQSIFKRYRKKR